MRELRQPRAQAAGGGAGDLRVRALPAAPAGDAPPDGRLGRRGELGQLAGLVESHELLVAADALSVDYDLGERHHARQAHELRATLRILGEVNLLIRDTELGKKGFGDA